MTQPEHRLRQYQLQLDPDGIEVGVSRQALEETLEKLETLRQENDRLQVQVLVLRDAIESFKRYAKHKPGQEAQFFRYLAQSARDGKHVSASTAVWDTAADALDALLTTQYTYDAIVERVRSEERERILKLIDSQTQSSELGNVYRHMRGLVESLGQKEEVNN